jgi:cell division initiation protein
MKVTPLEIRQKTFERTLRGYDKDEVNAFLLSLSQEWERNQDEMKELRVKLESAEREVAKLREVETSLFKTLKTAETTGANVVDQANKSAELILRESQLKADGLMNEAKNRARNVIEESEQTSRQLMEEMEDRLRGLSDQYKNMLSHRENLLADLRRIADETIDRVDRIKSTGRDFRPEQLLAEAKREVRKVLFPNEMDKPAPVQKQIVQETVLVESRVSYAETAPKSFFDDIQ